MSRRTASTATNAIPTFMKNNIPAQFNQVWVADIMYVRLRKGHVCNDLLYSIKPCTLNSYLSLDVQ
jgi:hypothetical protein